MNSTSLQSNSKSSTVEHLTAPFHDKLPRPSLNRALVSPAAKDSRLEPPRLAEKSPIPNPKSQIELPLDIDWAGLLLNFPLLTVKEAATELKCSDHQIRNFIDAGKLLAFPINAADDHQRSDYRIVRQTAAGAFTFQPAKARLELARQTIATVNLWLFAPFDPQIGAWQPALRIGARSVLTVDESAAALRCTGQHIRTLYDNQHLRALDIGKSNLESKNSLTHSIAHSPLHLRIARESLAAFVQLRLARQNNITL